MPLQKLTWEGQPTALGQGFHYLKEEGKKPLVFLHKHACGFLKMAGQVRVYREREPYVTPTPPPQKNQTKNTTPFSWSMFESIVRMSLQTSVVILSWFHYFLAMKHEAISKLF